MEHYFIDKSHDVGDFFSFNEEICGINLTIFSCSCLFSKDKIDTGSRTLIEAVKDYDFSGLGLDLCCGYGVIGIALSILKNANIDMCDINNTAVELAKKNKISNKVQTGEVKLSDGPLKKEYDYILSNPPIKVGKAVTFRLMDEAYEVLKDGGWFALVVRKDKGMESLKKYLSSKFNSVEIVRRNKGYYILKCVK